MTMIRTTIRVGAIACAALLGGTPATGALAGTAGSGLTLLYDLSGPAFDPDYLGFASARGPGTVYGVSQDGGGCQTCGTIFALTRPTPPGGQWTRSNLYAFDTRSPSSGPLVGPDGALYGTAWSTSSSGEVYRLRPPAAAGQPWSYDVLGGFTSAPLRGLVMDSAGALYTLDRANHLYQLAPPAGGGTPWTKSLVFTFPGQNHMPLSLTLSHDESAFYGTSDNSNVLYRLDRAGANLSRFYQLPAAHAKFTSNVVLDTAGDVFVTEFGQGSGSVLELVPPPAGQSAWNVQTLVSLKQADTPTGSIAMNPAGSLFGSTCCSPLAVYRLDPPGGSGSAWTYTRLNALPGAAPDVGSIGVTLGSGGNVLVEDSYAASGVLQNALYRQTPGTAAAR